MHRSDGRPSDTVSLATRITDPVTSTTELALLIDDRLHRLGPDYKATWRDWLHLSSLLNVRTAPTAIGTRTLADSESDVSAISATASASASLPPEWQELFENGTELERALALALAEAGIDLPTQGEETPGGIALGLAWPGHYIVVDIGFSHEDRTNLNDAQWHVVDATVDAVRDALTAGRL